MGLRVELESQDEIEKYRVYIDKILEALGHSEALVTDESKIWDFTFLEGEEAIHRLSLALGVSVDQSDYLVDVARKMESSEQEEGPE